jgi:hypothetical protein
MPGSRAARRAVCTPTRAATLCRSRPSARVRRREEARRRAGGGQARAHRRDRRPAHRRPAESGRDVCDRGRQLVVVRPRRRRQRRRQQRRAVHVCRAMARQRASTCTVVKGGESEIRSFLGHDADFVASISSFNGDDAILLYKDGAVADSLGDATYSDATPSFAFDDGYIVRKNCTAASSSFRISDWLPRRRVWPSGTSSSQYGRRRESSTRRRIQGEPTATARRRPLSLAWPATTAKTTPTPTARRASALDLLTCSSEGLCECKKGERGCGCIDGEDCDSGLVCRSTHRTACVALWSEATAAPAVRSLHWMWYVVIQRASCLARFA